MIDSVNFGDIQSWYASSGELSGFSDDLTLNLGHQYRIVIDGLTTSGAPITGTPEPNTMLLLCAGMIGFAAFKRSRKK